jgi:hypothetical protein
MAQWPGMGKRNLLVVGRVNEIAPGIVERVKKLKRRLFIHRTHAKLFPLVSNAHGTELEG